MTCEKLDLGGGAIAIACSRGKRWPKCKWCGRMAADKLCDAKVGAGTCDAKVCSSCADHVDANTDLCPTHARCICTAERVDLLCKFHRPRR